MPDFPPLQEYGLLDFGDLGEKRMEKLSTTSDATTIVFLMFILIIAETQNETCQQVKDIFFIY